MRGNDATRRAQIHCWDAVLTLFVHESSHKARVPDMGKGRSQVSIQMRWGLSCRKPRKAPALAGCILRWPQRHTELHP